MTQEEYNALSNEEKVALSQQKELPEETINMLINDEDNELKVQIMMNSEAIAKKVFASFGS